jgi:aminotransferase
VGWIVAPPDLTDVIRKVHDFLTVGAAHPLQMAGAAALDLPDSYYHGLAGEYVTRRDLLGGLLESAGFRTFQPQGAYYILCDISEFGFSDDVAFARHMIEHAGVAAVPGSSFFSSPELGRKIVRFCFCKKDETLIEAGQRLQRLKSTV